MTEEPTSEKTLTGRMRTVARVGAVLLLAAVALFASYGPAWKASRLQPMEALRNE